MITVKETEDEIRFENSKGEYLVTTREAIDEALDAEENNRWHGLSVDGMIDDCKDNCLDDDIYAVGVLLGELDGAIIDDNLDW